MKTITQSLTMRGIAIMLLAGIAPHFGIAADGAAGLVDAAFLIGGAVLAAYGRWRAGGLRV